MAGIQRPGGPVVRRSDLHDQVTLGSALGLDRPPSGERGDDLASERAGTSAPRPFTTRLMRDPIPSFVGRSSEIERLVRTLRFASGPVGLVSGARGVGGLGKSELCCKVASDLQAVLPVQIWIDLRTSTEQPLRPEQAVERVLRFLGGPLSRLPSEPEAQLALYRSKLSGQRALIIADDIRDAATIRALLPPPGCALLANSRSRIQLSPIGLASSYALELDGLQPSESSQLLRSLCPRLSSTQAGELAHRCAHAPLALQLIGQLLREDSRRSPVDVLALLDSERARLEAHRPGEGSGHDLQAAIAVAFRAIDPWGRQVLSNMAVLPLPSDGETLTTLAALPAHASAMPDVLRRLERSGLLEFDGRSGLYRMHEQVRQYAQSQLPPGHERAVRDRHATRLVHVLAGIEQQARGGSDALAEAMTQFDTCRAHFEAAQAWVTSTPVDKSGAATPAGAGAATDDGLRQQVALARASAGLLAQRLPAKARQRWLEGALAAARRLGDLASEAVLLLHVGHLQRELGQRSAAQASYAQCLGLGESSGDLALILRAEASLGHSHVEAAETEQAIPHFENAVAAARRLGDLRTEGGLLSSLGIAQLEAGQAGPAIAVLEQDLAIARRLGDKRAEGRALGNLGLAQRLAGQPDRAIDYYDQHIAIARIVSDRRGEANSAWNRALALEGLGRRGEAIASAEQALRLREAIADPRVEKVRAALAAWRSSPGS